MHAQHSVCMQELKLLVCSMPQVLPETMFLIVMPNAFCKPNT